jgi:hypothetical protein
VCDKIKVIGPIAKPKIKAENKAVKKAKTKAI